jgi:hypothetical protein
MARTTPPDQLSLFDLIPPAASPAPPPLTSSAPSPTSAAPPDLPAGPAPRNGRGRDYAQTVAALVRLRRPALLRERALEASDDSFSEAVAADWVVAMGCLLDPSAELSPLAEALDVAAVEVDLTDRGEEWCRLEWTVTATIRDSQALRCMALAACPPKDRGARATIRRSVGEAWRWASDPYAPLRHLPGIDWTPVAVTVSPQPARTPRGA